MDKNKLQKLKDIKYHINPCCGLCKYSNLEVDGWGTCDLHTYNHEKHTLEKRSLSIFRFGQCSSFKLSEVVEARLGDFDQFLAAE